MYPTHFDTHTLDNLPTPLPACNLWLADGVLRQHVERNGGGWAAAQLSDLGELAGGELFELGEQANLHRPRLRAFDLYGRSHRVLSARSDIAPMTQRDCTRIGRKNPEDGG